MDSENCTGLWEENEWNPRLGNPNILIAAPILKIESFKKPPLLKHCLLMWFPFPSLPCHSHTPCCCQCEYLRISTAILKTISQGSSDYHFCNRSQKIQNYLFPFFMCKDRFTTVLSVCLCSGPCFAPFKCHSLRIYPYPMVWPLPRPWPWSETMVSIPV